MVKDEKVRGRVTDPLERYAYGMVYLERGEALRALTEFEAALRDMPDDPGVLLGLGRCLVEVKRVWAGVEAFRRVVKLAPDYADARLCLGRALLVSGEKDAREAAVDELKEALNINPHYVEAREVFNGVMGAVDGGGRKGGRKKVVVEDRSNRDAQLHYYLGDALFREGLLVEGRRELEAAVRLKPGYADVRNRLGELLVQLGEYERAQGEFVAALRVNPRYYRALKNLAEMRLVYAERLLAEAEKDFVRAVEVAPGDQDVVRGLEKVRSLKGDDYF